MSSTCLTLRLELAGSFSTRLHGLLGRPSLRDGEGLCLYPCRAVHTFFLGYAIDVVFLDRRRRQRRHVPAVPPGRFVYCLAAWMAVELPAGYCLRHPDYLDRIHAALDAAFLSQSDSGSGSRSRRVPWRDS